MQGRVVRELQNKLPEEILKSYSEELNSNHGVLNQRKSDKNKVCSLHKPFTACIVKGKAHKQYEFGNKIGL